MCTDRVAPARSERCEIVRSGPGEKFPFEFGPMTDAQALDFPDNFYSTTITCASVPCP
jgi:hypothetical protein